MRARLLTPLLLLALVAAALVAVPSASAAAASSALSRPGQPWVASVGTHSATLRWPSVRGARSYEVRRGTVRIATTRSARLMVRGLKPATFQQFDVRAVAGARRSLASDPIAVVTRAATGCTHYVSSNGSDRGAGTAASPWRSLTRLVDAWRPGWVGCVAGDFIEDVSIRRGGMPSQQVTLRTWPGWQASLRGRLWIAAGADDVVVQGLRLDGRALAGVTRADLPSPTINGNRAMLLGNDISNAGTRVCAVLGSIRGYGSTTGTTLAYNRVHHCGQRGDNTHHGIYMESTRDVRIVHNAIFANADRGIQLYPDAQRSIIAGNFIYANGQGIIFSGAEGYSSSGNRVIGNVIAGSQLRSNLEHYWEAPSRPGTGNIAARNCLGGAVQGNIALPVAGYTSTGNRTGVLRLRAAASGDFRPLATSGCRTLLRSAPLPLRPLF